MSSSYLFKIIPSNFFQLLSSINKDIYIDCLLILEKLADEDDDFNIKKNIALNGLEKYFVEKNRILFQEEINKQDFVIDNRQKAFQVLTSLYKHGWIGEEKISYNITNIHFFDYSLEMIYFFKKNIYQVKPESIGNIYSIYSLLKSFLVEKNYTSFQESLLKTKSLLVKLKILKTSIFRFYNQLINLNFNYNLQNVLEQFLLDYKKNFFDSSYFILKTTDNFLKYCIQINLFLKEIETNPIYFREMNNQLKKINKNSSQMNINLIKNQIQDIKINLISTDKLINIIDQKNEQYLETACAKILFFDNQKKNIENLLNYFIQLILNEEIDASSFVNLWNIKNLDDLSFYKPRVKKLEIMTSMLDVIPEDIELNLKEKKKSILEQKDFLTHKNINLFVKECLNQKQTLKASEIILKTNHDIVRLILIYIYARSKTYDNIYQIKKLNVKVNSYNFSFFDFLIFKK